MHRVDLGAEPTVFKWPAMQKVKSQTTTPPHIGNLYRESVILVF